MNNLNLAPPLARELQDRVNTAARHAIAQDLNAYRHTLGFWRLALEVRGSIYNWDAGHIVKGWSDGNYGMSDHEDEDHDMPIYMEREDYEERLCQNRAGALALVELAQHFPRPHGRACLSCQRRPVFVTMGHTTTDFCQACLEMIEESQDRRNYR